jgi:hypothetical protein
MMMPMLAGLISVIWLFHSHALAVVEDYSARLALRSPLCQHHVSQNSKLNFKA